MKESRRAHNIGERLAVVGVALCAFSLSMPTFYFNLIMPLALFLRIVFSSKESLLMVARNYLYMLFSFSFALLIIGLSYTQQQNLDLGITLILKRLPLILLPFILTNLSKTAYKSIMLAFMLGVLFGAIVCIINVVTTPNVYGHLKQIYISNWYWSDIILEPIDKHPSYFAIYATLSFFIGLKFFQLTNRILFKIFYSLMMLFFIAIILTLESRIVIFSFPILLFVYIIFKTKKIMIGLAFFIVMVGLGTVYFAYHPARFHNIRILKISKDSNIRLNIYETSLSLIKESPICGVGSGDIFDEMNKEYVKRGYVERLNYNCHNQFLEEWLRGGVLSLIIFILILLMMLKNAIKGLKAEYVIFILLIIIFSMVESFMNRQQGITFFLFFGTMYYFLNEENKNLKASHLV